VIKAYTAVQGYQFDAMVTNQVTRQPHGTKSVKASVLGPEQETVSVAYSEPDRLRIVGTVNTTVDIFRDAGNSFIMRTGSHGYTAGNGVRDRRKGLAKRGLTDYTAIEDYLWEARSLHDEDVTVDGLSVPCKVIQATYRVPHNTEWRYPNRPDYWVEKRTFWVDTTRYVVLREVDLVHGLESVEGADFQHAVAVKKLVWNRRPPDALFDVPTISGITLSDGTVTSLPNGVAPDVPIVNGCQSVADPSARAECMRDAQGRGCQSLPLTPEVRIAHLSGSVELAYTIDTEGKPVDIHVTRSLGLGLDEQAAECVSHWRWRPAEKDGKPLAAPTIDEIPMGVDNESVWHLRHVEFRPAKDASRPVFLKAAYPPTNLPNQHEQVTGFSLFHLRLTIGKDGVPRAVQVAPSVDPKLDKQAVQIVSKWRFRPGIEDGVPVEVLASFDLGLGEDIRGMRQNAPVIR
jgi:TonB family protein